MVLNRMPTSPASTTPFFTSSARSFRCMLQGLPSYQTAADADLGFVHVVFAHAGGIEHGLAASLGFGLGDT